MLCLRGDPVPALVVALDRKTHELSVSQLTAVARAFAGIWPRLENIPSKMNLNSLTDLRLHYHSDGQSWP